ncbi:MAG: S-layer homology domain-containing protein [Clostridiales bacterium]|nr:S-layer homology domain-containing protein [Clostridiales bacterium]MCF8022780.1 S-layer homology domain-containing protein [Clostridiales bacterium]
MCKKLIIMTSLAVFSLFTFVMPGQAEEISSLYNQVKEDNQEYIDTLTEYENVNENKIEEFVDDLESELTGVTLTGDNFEEEMMKAALSAAGKNEEVTAAITDAYPNSVEQALGGDVPSGFEPIYNTVEDQLVEDSNENSPGGGGGRGPAPGIEDEEVKEEQKEEEIPAVEEKVPQQQKQELTCDFKDIEGHWAQKEVKVMAGEGIIAGVTEQKFEPGEHVTRAQLAAILVRMLNIDNTNGSASGYQDVKQDAWYHNVVNTISQAGLINGYNENTFGPDNPVTRQQVAVILNRVIQKKGSFDRLNKTINSLNTFDDSESISSWARQSTANMVQYGLIAGRQNNRFAPLDKTTRAEIVVLLYRLRNQVF